MFEMQLLKQKLSESREPSEPAPKMWLYGPAADAATLLSGMTLVFLFLAVRPWHFDDVLVLYFVACERFMALAHSWSTTYLVTGSKMFRPLRQANRTKFQTIPILIFLFSMILGLLITKTVEIPDDGTVDAKSWLYYLYIGLFMFGHFWHFGRQDFGVLSLYRQKADQFSARDRQADQLYCQTMMYLVQPIMYALAFIHFPFTQMLFWLPSVATSLETLGKIALVVGVLAYAIVLALELKKSNRSLPKLIYYTVIAFHPTMLYFANSGLMPYWYLSYLWSHWIIATSLSMHIHTRYQVQSKVDLKRAIFNHVGVVSVVSLVAWIITNPYKEFAILNKDFVDAREILRTMSPDQFTLIGFFLGFLLGEQLVHYYCDRMLFRFKDPAVRAAVGPFL